MQTREPNIITAGTPCTECGLQTLAHEPTCAQIFDALLARDFEQPALYWQYHRLVVDAYALQHQPYVKSAKSLAAHLCGVCITFEHSNDAGLLDRLQRWLSTNPPIKKPELPKCRGALTISHILGIEDPVEYGRRVQAWAQSAWKAYSDLQPTAREWIALSCRSAK